VQRSEQAVRGVVWQFLRLRRVEEDNLEFTQVRPFVMTVVSAKSTTSAR
jgi:hypothetical protein